MSTTILLADDHRIFREGLRALLENEPSLEVIADAADGRTTVKLAQKLSPDVVIYGHRYAWFEWHCSHSPDH